MFRSCQMNNILNRFFACLRRSSQVLGLCNPAEMRKFRSCQMNNILNMSFLCRRHSSQHRGLCSRSATGMFRSCRRLNMLVNKCAACHHHNSHRRASDMVSSSARNRKNPLRSRLVSKNMKKSRSRCCRVSGTANSFANSRSFRRSRLPCKCMMKSRSSQRPERCMPGWMWNSCSRRLSRFRENYNNIG